MRHEPREVGEPPPLDIDLLYRQEAFARVHRSWDRIEDRARAVSYLRATAFNLARSGFRRRRPRLDADVVLAERSAEDGFALREDQRQVWRALESLPDRQRACVVLRYYADAGIDDIAATLHIGRNSVKTHLKRGLAALERRLEPER